MSGPLNKVLNRVDMFFDLINTTRHSDLAVSDGLSN